MFEKCRTVASKLKADLPQSTFVTNVARCRSWKARTPQNNYQNKRLTEIPRWTKKPKPLASH